MSITGTSKGRPLPFLKRYTRATSDSEDRAKIATRGGGWPWPWYRPCQRPRLLAARRFCPSTPLPEHRRRGPIPPAARENSAAVSTEHEPPLDSMMCSGAPHATGTQSLFQALQVARGQGLDIGIGDRGRGAFRTRGIPEPPDGIQPPPHRATGGAPSPGRAARARNFRYPCKKDDGHGLDPFRPEKGAGLLHGLFVEGCQYRPHSHPPAPALPAAAAARPRARAARGTGRIYRSGPRVRFSSASRKPAVVIKPVRLPLRSMRALVISVGTVHSPPHGASLHLPLLEQVLHPCQYAGRGIGIRGEDLAGHQRVGSRIEQHQIGEGAAYVDGQQMPVDRISPLSSLEWRSQTALVRLIRMDYLQVVSSPI